MNTTNSQLQKYQLKIINGEYPFKNSHISKIFDVKVYTQIQMNSKVLHRILQISKSIQHPFLINILSVQVINQNKTRLQYEYIDTPLIHYIRRFKNSNIQIKLQKFYMQLRNLASKFVMKNVNILNGIDYKNIGVKMMDVYRQTLTMSACISEQNNNRKQIKMPEFKVYIDLQKCQIIQKMSDVARLVIQTDKMIYTKISTLINQLLKKVESEQMPNLGFKIQPIQSRNRVYSMSQTLINLQNQPNFKKQITQTNNMEGFSNKLKKRKRIKTDKIQAEKIECKKYQTKHEDQKSYEENTLAQRFQQRKNSLYSSQFFSKQLNHQVHDIVQKSRKALQNFKLLIKNKN